MRDGGARIELGADFAAEAGAPLRDLFFELEASGIDRGNEFGEAAGLGKGKEGAGRDVDARGGESAQDAGEFLFGGVGVGGEEGQGDVEVGGVEEGDADGGIGGEGGEPFGGVFDGPSDEPIARHGN